MFFNSRVVPATPPSLVKFAASVPSLTSGCGNSAPISDQVPELMYAHDSPRAGTAATAEPVSCVAGATTGTGVTPVSVATDLRNGPSTVPGGTTVPSIFVGRPNFWIRSYAQPRLAGSSIWLVLASVNSLTLMPVKK